MEDAEMMQEQQAEAPETAAEPQEMSEEPQDQSESIDSFLAEGGQQDQDPDSEGNGEQGTGEPGYVRKRIDKAIAAERARMQADYDRKMAAMQVDFERQMAPLREQMLNTQAQELVRSGTVKDLETARELIRYRMGNGQMPAGGEDAPQAEPQPRNEKGQFAPRETAPRDDPKISTRVEMLSHQADSIKARTGIDVIPVFQNDEDIKQKVVSGEMDFYDVAELMKQQSARKKTPSPMRSPNGASGAEKSTIANMTDEQFRRFEKKLEGGARFRV